MAKRPQNAKEWLERYKVKLDKAFRNYQDSGDAKYDRQAEEYEVICDALEAKIAMNKEREIDIKKRMNNRDWAIDKLIKPEYTKEEVKELLNDAVYW